MQLDCKTVRFFSTHIGKQKFLNSPVNDKYLVYPLRLFIKHASLSRTWTQI